MLQRTNLFLAKVDDIAVGRAAISTDLFTLERTCCLITFVEEEKFFVHIVDGKGVERFRWFSEIDQTFELPRVE